jgi:pimeloyl-ACP methyl ester carboxylesterase
MSQRFASAWMSAGGLVTVAINIVVTVATLAGCSSPPAATPSTTTAATPEPAAALQPAAPEAGGDADVTLATLDGVSIAASYSPGPAGSDRAVVFLHQLSSTRKEWHPFVEALRGKYHLLALDMRGHGQSTRSERGTLDWQTFQTADWEAVTGDLAAATQFLSQKGVALGGVVIVGSSIGSSAALRFAGEHPDLGGVVLFSPGLKYKGVETVPSAQRYGKPKLVIFSGDAEDAARVLEQAWKKAAGLPQPQPVTMHAVPGDAHGVKMLADDPSLVEVVVGFVEETLAR